jgi:transketolase
MVDIQLVPLDDFRRIGESVTDRYERLALLADMCRVNTLATVKRAGSGHLGSSFSSLDIVTWLYYAELNTIRLGITHPDRDIYFSSKGHDVPGFYAVLFSLGVLPREQFIRLRRIDGTCGHPDVTTPGIEANSGSLGMGISKGKGMAIAKRLLGRKGRVFVMTGDGELHEGQIYEALQTAAHQRIGNLHVIVDHNKLQTDKRVSEIIDLGDLEAKFRAFGWHVARCDGHDLQQLEAVFAEFRTITDRPKIVIADTIKGRGVSFMEHPAALHAGGGLYRWHAGAPDDESYRTAHREIVERINRRLAMQRIDSLRLGVVEPEEQQPSAGSLQGEQDSQIQQPKRPSAVSSEYVADAFGAALVEIGATRPDLVVLDADLSADCRLRGFEQAYPDRFIENGIAEQDMVSMAGGLARQGLLPVVNSFGAFLAARANEQIYNNGCERTKIVYVCHYAGLIPAGPGQSHQSIRDISLLGALPNVEIVQPCNAAETRMLLDYCVNGSDGSTMMRLIIGPSPRLISFSPDYRLQHGRGVALTDGWDALLFGYGPVMLHEALVAAQALAQRGVGLRVINMPWLNRIDGAWLADTIASFRNLFVIEDHAPCGGLGDTLLNALASAQLLDGRRFEKLAVEGYPAWGTPPQALAFHRLNGASVAQRIRAVCGEGRRD